MRLHIRVNDIDYYDIGLRGGCTTDEYTMRFGELQPKYLEDFIKRYGQKRIRIITYGSLINKRDEIDKMLS